MSNAYWEEQPSFDILCNMVAKGNFVCLTGAGISNGLENSKGEKIPDWPGLLEQINKKMKEKPEIYDRLSDKEKSDIETLLGSGDWQTLKDFKQIVQLIEKGGIECTLDQKQKDTISGILERDLLSSASAGYGERLIAVASILRKADEKLFDKLLMEIVETTKEEPSLTHKALVNLNPLGIMTYNYDKLHEAAGKEQGARKKYNVVIPSDKEKIRDLIREPFDWKHPFLLKAHGSSGRKDSMVLTSDSYSDLFTKYSYYKTLVQDILMNHQLLIVGFGMSDPDFDRMIRDLFTTFGAPIQTHVVITHEDNKGKNDVLYSHNYGFEYLYVKKFPDIPLILEDCTKHVGTYVKGILDGIIAGGEDKKGIKTRSLAHRDLRGLNQVAKNIVAKELEKKILRDISFVSEEGETINHDERFLFELCENVYSYGCLLDPETDPDGDKKDFMIENVINKCHDPKTLRHALYQIADYLKPRDLKHIREWIQMFEDEHYFSDYGFKEEKLKRSRGRNNPEKITYNAVYCHFLEALVNSKYYLDKNSPGINNQT